MIKISNFLLISIVLLVIFPSQLSMYSRDLTLLTGIGVISFVSMNILLIIFYRNLNLNIPFFISLIFIGLIFSSLITYGVIQKIKPLIVYGSLISLFFVVRIFSYKILDLDRLVIGIVYGACLTGIFIMFLGLNYPFSFNRYQGFFNNPNNMGTFSAGLIHMTGGVLYAFNKKLHQSKRIFFILVFSISFIFLFASNSRAAIFSIFLLFGFLLAIQGIKMFNFTNFTIHISYLKKFFKYFIFLCLFFIIAYYFGLLENTLSKFYKPNWQGGTSGHRIDGWLFSIDNWTWFGHKNIYVFARESENINLSVIKGLGHNTWLSHLNNYGLIATSFFITWILFMLCWAMNEIKNKKDKKSAIVLFSTLLGFIGNATFETATSTPGMLVSVILFAILYKKNQDSYIGKNV